ncbi:GNAT family N-acetyltransferase [Chitinophaga horti]|uniref:GNAT family N-acetyltransferase n=1 Tax=Chitinophaga horti TaxID=2920382 RepID=A0ABY6IVY6_9BACT|nr:GNAT family N-acetyltransferase [Chitinophaga horti]UYQ91538.1 GNAT family N-acetyltransferase [Chitinophaga horti]
MIYRTIRKEDNEHLAVIIRAGIAEFDVPTEGTAYTDPTTDDLFTLFQAPGSAYTVAEEHGLILGGCGVYPTAGLPGGYAELVRFFLAAEARGKGIGRLLMERTFDMARELGYTHLYIESFPEMKKAVGMYEKAGFNYLDKALGNSGHYACNVWMVKAL